MPECCQTPPGKDVEVGVHIDPPAGNDKVPHAGPVAAGTEDGGVDAASTATSFVPAFEMQQSVASDDRASAQHNAR
jgi:hypothetical protein